MNCVGSVLIILFLIKFIACFVDVSLNNGQPIIPKDDKFVNFDNLRLKKVNKTGHYIVGEIVTFVSLGNEHEVINFTEIMEKFHQPQFQVEVLIYKKAGNEYKLTPYHVGPYKFCDYVQKYAVNYDEILKVSDFPQRKDCPWELKTYTIRGYRLPTEKVPKFLEGEFMAEVRILMDQKLMQGYQLSFTVMRF